MAIKIDFFTVPITVGHNAGTVVDRIILIQSAGPYWILGRSPILSIESLLSLGVLTDCNAL